MGSKVKKEKGKFGALRMVIIGVVAIIVLAFVIMRGDQLKELYDAIQKGSPIFIVLAVAAQLGKYASQGFGFRACFNVVDAPIDFKTGLSLVFGTFFVNTVAPSMNLAGTSLVMETAHRKGYQAGKGTGAALLMQLCIDSGFVIIMLIAFGILSLTVGLQPGWFLVGLVAIALVGGLVLVMVLGGMKPKLMIRILKPLERLANKVLRLFKKGPIDGWVDRTIMSFSDAAGNIVKSPAKTARAYAFSIFASICEIACFCFVGMAFGIYSPEPLICGYVIATLFAMISPVPQGVGIVEAAVTVAFGMFQIDAAVGLTIVMVYRGIVFWLPFLIGAIVIQRIGAKGN